jgi:AraC-like DNA-binding protein
MIGKVAAPDGIRAPSSGLDDLCNQTGQSPHALGPHPGRGYADRIGWEAIMPATFDLDTVSKPSRYATLQDLMTHVPVPIDVRMSSIDRLHVSTVSDFFGGIFLISCNGRGAVVGRDESLVRRDHARTMMLSVVTAGTSRLQQGDTVSDLRRGDVVGYSSVRPYRATFDDVSKHTYMIDYDALGLPDRILHAQLGRRVNAGHALGIIVARYLTDLGSHAVYLSDPERAALEQPTLDLLRALFAATAGDEPRTREPLHASLGTRMIEFVKMHLTDPGLSIAMVAHEHGISERYAYLILSRSGIALADWVRTQRLAGAARELTRATDREETIAQIAYRWGFTDHASFTRAFRRTYGLSPRDYRRANAPAPTEQGHDVLGDGA